MTNVNSPLFSLLYGREISAKDAALVGAIFGVAGYLLFESGLCAGEIPDIPLCIIMLPLVPFLFFLLVGPVLNDIRNPRRPGIPFVAAFSYAKRKSLFSDVIFNTNRCLVLFVAVSLGCNFILNTFFHHKKPQAWTIIPASLSLLIAFALSHGAVLLVKKGIVGPSKKDAAESGRGGKSSTFRRFLIRTTWSLSVLIASLLRGRIRVLVVRQLTDIFRANTVNSIISLPFLIIIAVLFKLVLNDAALQVTQIVFLAGAYGMILINGSSLLSSSMIFSRLPLYSFSMRELFIGNCSVFTALTGLFPVVYILSAAIDAHQPITAISLLQFAVSYVYLMVVSGAWHTLSAIPGRSVFSSVLLYSYMVIILLSLYIPGYGLFFPAGLTVMLFAAESLLLSKNIFHKELLKASNE